MIMIIIYQDDNYYNCFTIIISVMMKHLFFSYLEQLETSMVGPSQFLPPQRGAGLLQDLERHKQELTPSTPSSLLQACHGAQAPKPPLVVWFRSCKSNIQSWWELDHVGKQPGLFNHPAHVCQWLLRGFMIFRAQGSCCQTGLFPSKMEWESFLEDYKGIHFPQIFKLQPNSIQLILV